MWATLDLPEGTQATLTLSLPNPEISPTVDLRRISIQDEASRPTESAQLVLGPVLGKGGMGIVHSARQPLLDRDVAIKQLLPGGSASAGVALMREARFMGSLEHPNIVPVHDLGAGSDGLPVLVMKRIDGAPWQELLEYPDHPAWAGLEDRAEDQLGRNISVLLDLCRAVRWAHGRGVVHRDLKPDNVMIGNDGEVYLGDWGVAGRSQEVSGSVVGTPAFMAPEMLDKDAIIDPQMDVYLLGSCLHQLLTGRLRHGGTTLEEIFQSVHISGPIEAGPEVPIELAQLCQRATAPDPAQRPTGVSRFAEALRSWVRHRDADRLARAAALRAEHLRTLLSEDEADPVAVLTTAAEVRFGLHQALEGWPEHPTARDDLVAALREMTRFAISREDLDMARARLSELVTLGEEEGPLGDELTAVAEEVQSRRQLAVEMDLSVGASQRMAVLVLLWVAGIGISIYAWSAGVAEQLTHEMLLQFAILFLGSIIVGVFLARRALSRNTVNRQIAVALLVWGLLLLGHRVAVIFSFESIEPLQVLVTDLWVLASAGAILAVLRPRLLAGFAGVSVIAAIVATVSPDLSVLAMTIVGSIAPLASYTLYLWTGRSRALTGPAAPRS